MQSFVGQDIVPLLYERLLPRHNLESIDSFALDMLHDDTICWRCFLTGTRNSSFLDEILFHWAESVVVFTTVSVGWCKVDEVDEIKASDCIQISALAEAKRMEETVKERALVIYNVFYEILD